MQGLKKIEKATLTPLLISFGRISRLGVRASEEVVGTHSNNVYTHTHTHTHTHTQCIVMAVPSTTETVNISVSRSQMETVVPDHSAAAPQASQIIGPALKVPVT